MMTDSTKGVLSAILAFCLFASLPAYVQLLQPLSGYTVFGQRILWTSILLFGSLLLFARGDLREVGRRLRCWRSWPGYLLGSWLVGIQFWAFVWGPMNGMTLDVALGYFMLPLTMVITGRLLYKEQLRPLQWLAVCSALLGVVSALLLSGGFSWLALLIALGYPPYFVLRRYQPLPPLHTFSIENILLLPIAIFLCIHFGAVEHPFAYGIADFSLFAGLGLLGALPMLLWLGASRILTFGVLGLVGNVEPLLIFVIGLLQGEQVSGAEWLLYGLIFFSLLLLLVDGLKLLLKRRARLRSA
ncbi:MAG: chloramphenicol-sensitive protein RarD [Motiliproteus sp.]|jgi:chloramphenicol-sensitive protein RarD